MDSKDIEMHHVEYLIDLKVQVKQLQQDHLYWVVILQYGDYVFHHLIVFFLSVRRKDDPLNAIMAGAATGGVLAWRAGYSSMLRAAGIGGVFLALIEGLGLIMQKTFAGGQPQQQGPISPYSTYKPIVGRHVGDLDSPIGNTLSPSDISEDVSNTNIYGKEDNSNTWHIQEQEDNIDDLGFSFSEFTDNPQLQLQSNQGHAFDSQMTFGKSNYDDDDDDDDD